MALAECLMPIALQTSAATNQGVASMESALILLFDSKEKTDGEFCAVIAITFVVRLITTAETNQLVVNCAELVLPATKDPAHLSVPPHSPP
ncbi:hypothetical protein [Cedecea davisae]|uniref:hypothetical protein n=1 Tax=Cedecea davisae TaxID=158484 RepID=UPI0027E00469|nr:hypothetical protein [Cedecea davisae]